MTLRRRHRAPDPAKPRERIMLRTNATLPQKSPKGATSRRHVLETMAKLFGWRTLVEVGVWKADTSVYLLENCPELHWIGRDTYTYQPGDFSQPGWCNYPGDMEKRYQEAKARVAVFGARAQLLRGSSSDTADLMPDSTVDAVFIDADHRYEKVLGDIDAWRPKVKPGGWLLGHDRDMPSVMQAVNERFPEALMLPDRMWAVRL